MDELLAKGHQVVGVDNLIGRYAASVSSSIDVRTWAQLP